MRTNVTPPMIKALLPRRFWGLAPSFRTPRWNSPATPTQKPKKPIRAFRPWATRRPYTPAIFPSPIYNLVQDQFTPRRIRSLVPRAPVRHPGQRLSTRTLASPTPGTLTATFNGSGPLPPTSSATGSRPPASWRMRRFGAPQSC